MEYCPDQSILQVLQQNDVSIRWNTRFDGHEATGSVQRLPWQLSHGKYMSKTFAES